MIRKLLVFIFLVVSVNVSAQSNLGLRNFTAVLQAQNVKDAQQFLSFKNRKTYSLLDASYIPDQIDLAFMYGNNTGLNLIAPFSSAIGSFGAKYKINVQDGWDVKKEGSLIVVRDIVKVQMQFKEIKSLTELKELFAYYELNISGLPGYKSREFGPSDNTARMQDGDIVLFKSFTTDDLYAIGKVVSSDKSYTGEMKIDWKIPKKIN